MSNFASFGLNLSRYNVIKNLSNNNQFDNIKDVLKYRMDKKTHDHIYYLCNYNPGLIHNTFIEICTDLTKNYKELLNNDISTNHLDLNNIIEYWNEFNLKTNYLYPIMKNIYSRKCEYSFNDVRHNIFIKYIINGIFEHNILMHYLESLILKAINESIVHLINFINILKIIVSTFNIEYNNKNICDMLGKNENILSNKMVIYLHNLIMQNNPNISDYDMEIVNYFSNKNIFKLTYIKYLTCRLLSNNYEINMEKNIIEKMESQIGKNITGDMKKLINDIEENYLLYNKYKKIKVLVKSDKYKDIPINENTFEIFKPTIIRMFRCKSINSKENDLPDEDIFNKELDLNNNNSRILGKLKKY